LEEFSPKLEYIQGEKNVIADTLSRLGRKKDVTPIVGKNDAPSKDTQNDSLDSFFSHLMKKNWLSASTVD